MKSIGMTAISVSFTTFTLKNKKRTADAYNRTVLLLPKSTQHSHYCFLLIFTQIVPYL